MRSFIRMRHLNIKRYLSYILEHRLIVGFRHPLLPRHIHHLLRQTPKHLPREYFNPGCQVSPKTQNGRRVTSFQKISHELYRRTSYLLGSFFQDDMVSLQRQRPCRIFVQLRGESFAFTKDWSPYRCIPYAFSHLTSVGCRKQTWRNAGQQN